MSKVKVGLVQMSCSNNKEAGPALVGIELKSREDYDALLNNLNKYHIGYTELSKDNTLFSYLV